MRLAETDKRFRETPEIGADDRPAQPPMAILHWDFDSPHPGVRIKGATDIRSADDAMKIRDLMNKEHGDGPHWVETLNWSWEERHAVRSEDS
jgi:hypothetical protein